MHFLDVLRATGRRVYEGEMGMDLGRAHNHVRAARRVCLLRVCVWRCVGVSLRACGAACVLVVCVCVCGVVSVVSLRACACVASRICVRVRALECACARTSCGWTQSHRAFQLDEKWESLKRARTPRAVRGVHDLHHMDAILAVVHAFHTASLRYRLVHIPRMMALATLGSMESVREVKGEASLIAPRLHDRTSVDTSESMRDVVRFLEESEAGVSLFVETPLVARVADTSRDTADTLESVTEVARERPLYAPGLKNPVSWDVFESVGDGVAEDGVVCESVAEEGVARESVAEDAGSRVALLSGDAPRRLRAAAVSKLSVDATDDDTAGDAEEFRTPSRTR